MCACEDGVTCRRCREDVERYERDDEPTEREKIDTEALLADLMQAVRDAA